MIRLNRERAARAVPNVFRGAKRRVRELDLLKAKRQSLQDGRPLALASSLWKPAKKQLLLESGGKCGYCEADASTVCHCDVEHIRPKAIYWWLALCYDNYTAACQLCNQTYKSDQYPVAAAPIGGPMVTAQDSDQALAALVGTFAPDPIEVATSPSLVDFEAQFAGESPGLINPYLEDPEQFLAWLPDADLHEVSAAPLHREGHPFWRATKTIDVLGLNREELRRARWRTYQEVAALCEIYSSGCLDGTPKLKADTEAALKAAMEPDHSFAAMCRWTVRRQFSLNI